MIESFTPVFEGCCLEEKFVKKLSLSIFIADWQKISRLYLFIPYQDGLDQVIIRGKRADAMIFPKNFSELELIFVLIQHSVDSFDLGKSIDDVT